MTNLTLMTLNVGINNKYTPTLSPGEKKEEKKREYIRDQIIARIDPKPDVLFLQEANKPDDTAILGYLGSDDNKQDLYESFFIAKIKKGYKQRILIRKSLLVKESQPIIHKYCVNGNNRLVLLRVILTEPADQICYFASWHGPHKAPHKKGTAKKLITYIKNKCQGHPFIIGGDFNLKASDFRTAVSDVISN